MAAGDAGPAPMPAGAQSLVESFCGITSATPAEAAFYLEGHNWALDSAVQSYYDSADGDAGAADPEPPLPPPPPTDAGGSDSEDEDYVAGGDEDDVVFLDDEDAALASAAAAAEERRRRRPSKRLKSSHDARGASGSGSRAGVRANGAGNVMPSFNLGGGRRAAGSDDAGEDAEWAPPPQNYTGGERSGMVVRDRSKRKNKADEVFKQAKRKGAKQDLFMPRPLRSFDDPANASFLESIKNSDCPTELEPADRKSKQPVKRAAPFQGERRTCAAPSDNNTSSAAASSTTTAPRTITVDDSLPSTSIQIRFADGSRLVARFNTSHTISDVRAFIDATRPEASEYMLQAGFPPKPLEDATKTIEEAGVANSVIIQSV